MDTKDKQILLNSIQCKHCKEIIVSRHVHDYVRCSCGQVSVDGGTHYLRRGFIELTDYKELSKFDDGKHKTRRSSLTWGVNYDKNMKKLKKTEWRFIKNLDTEHIEAILKTQTHIGPFYTEVFKRELLFRENKNL